MVACRPAAQGAALLLQQLQGFVPWPCWSVAPGIESAASGSHHPLLHAGHEISPFRADQCVQRFVLHIHIRRRSRYLELVADLHDRLRREDRQLGLNACSFTLSLRRPALGNGYSDIDHVRVLRWCADRTRLTAPKATNRSTITQNASQPG